MSDNSASKWFEHANRIESMRDPLSLSLGASPHLCLISLRRVIHVLSITLCWALLESILFKTSQMAFVAIFWWSTDVPGRSSSKRDSRTTILSMSSRSTPVQFACLIKAVSLSMKILARWMFSGWFWALFGQRKTLWSKLLSVASKFEFFAIGIISKIYR